MKYRILSQEAIMALPDEVLNCYGWNRRMADFCGDIVELENEVGDSFSYRGYTWHPQQVELVKENYLKIISENALLSYGEKRLLRIQLKERTLNENSEN